MHEFTLEQLKEIAAASQENVKTIWEMFGLDGPQPSVNAGLAWAVLTAALGNYVVTVREHDEAMRLATKRACNDAFDEAYAKATAEDHTVSTDMETVNDRRAQQGLSEEKLEAQAALDQLGKHQEAFIPAQAELTDAASELTDALIPPAPTDAAPVQEEPVRILAGKGDAPESMTPTDPAPRSNGARKHFATGEERHAALRQVIAELQHMAVGNIMPTPAQYDEKKPADLPTAEMVMLRFQIDWPTLASYAKLEMVKRGRPRKQVAY